MTPESLQWSTNALEELYQYLDKKNTKAFIILKNGRIAIEYYFDGFSANNPWYWASAGKTLTATAAGIAQDEGLIDIIIKCLIIWGLVDQRSFRKREFNSN